MSQGIPKPQALEPEAVQAAEELKQSSPSEIDAVDTTAPTCWFVGQYQVALFAGA
jgi:hypothetical protein